MINISQYGVWGRLFFLQKEGRFIAQIRETPASEFQQNENSNFYSIANFLCHWGNNLISLRLVLLRHFVDEETKSQRNY